MSKSFLAHNESFVKSVPSDTVSFKMVHVGSFVKHTHCPTQSSIKIGNLRLII